MKDGKTELVAEARVTWPGGNGGAEVPEDLFEGLVSQLDALLEKLREDVRRAEVRVARRWVQIPRLERAIKVLKGEKLSVGGRRPGPAAGTDAQHKSRVANIAKARDAKAVKAAERAAAQAEG